MNKKVQEGAKTRKPTLCIDFDGVIHDYNGVWKNVHTISGPVIPGALQFLVEAQKEFRIAIFSARSRYWRGRVAMRKWITGQLIATGSSYHTTPSWLLEYLREVGLHNERGVWSLSVQNAAHTVVHGLNFPKYKPPATIFLDDRALTFTGKWPSIERLQAFTPWNRQNLTVGYTR